MRLVIVKACHLITRFNGVVLQEVGDLGVVGQISMHAKLEILCECIIEFLEFPLSFALPPKNA